jgi:hypothetical protein
MSRGGPAASHLTPYRPPLREHHTTREAGAATDALAQHPIPRAAGVLAIFPMKSTVSRVPAPGTLRAPRPGQRAPMVGRPGTSTPAP